MSGSSVFCFPEFSVFLVYLSGFLVFSLVFSNTYVIPYRRSSFVFLFSFVVIFCCIFVCCYSFLHFVCCWYIIYKPVYFPTVGLVKSYYILSLDGVFSSHMRSPERCSYTY